MLQREAEARGASVAGFVRTLVMDHVRRTKRKIVSLHTNTRTIAGTASISGDMADKIKSPQTTGAN